jgi:hypothetical protein
LEVFAGLAGVSHLSSLCASWAKLLHSSRNAIDAVFINFTNTGILRLLAAMSEFQRCIAITNDSDAFLAAFTM